MQGEWYEFMEVNKRKMVEMNGGSDQCYTFFMELNQL